MNSPGSSFVLLFNVLLDIALWTFRYPMHALSSLLFSGLGANYFHSGLLLSACSIGGVAVYQGMEQWLLPRLWRFRILYKTIRFLLIVIHFVWGAGIIYGIWFFEIESPEVNEVLRIAASLWGGMFVVRKLRQRLNAESL
jgi:hypothetical protein